MEKFKFLSADKILKLPEESGVYCFAKRKKILYIGKAANIKKRVKNHFSQPSYKDNLFISQTKKIGYIKTNSEIEAFILEAKLIKKYQPKFNIVWRDDKNYFYICISEEDFPKVFITHQPITESKIKNKELKGGNSKLKLIGPFVDGKSLKETLKILRKVFPYRTCKKLPKNPCLWYQLQRCPAPCLVTPQVPGFREKIKKECQRNIKNLMQILEGKKLQALKNLKREMANLAKEEKFEQAQKIKNQIKALENVMFHARIFEFLEAEPPKNWPYYRAEAYDISNIQGKEATGSMVVFNKGFAAKSQYRKFKIKMAKKPNDVAMLKEVLTRRLKHEEWPLPDLILIDGGKAQLNVAVSIIKNQNFLKRAGARLKRSKMRGNKRKKMGFQVMVMALAKKENKLYIKGKKEPVLLKNLPRETFNLILQLRDEAHRFAIAYHHKLRLKGLAR